MTDLTIRHTAQSDLTELIVLTDERCSGTYHLLACTGRPFTMRLEWRVARQTATVLWDRLTAPERGKCVRHAVKMRHWLGCSRSLCGYHPDRCGLGQMRPAVVSEIYRGFPQRSSRTIS